MITFEKVTMGGGTPRAYEGTDFHGWYFTPESDPETGKPMGGTSPKDRHEEALRALQPIAYIKEWAKAQKALAPTPIRRKPGRKPRLDPVKWVALAAFDAALKAAEAVMEARSHAA